MSTTSHRHLQAFVRRPNCIPARLLYGIDPSILCAGIGVVNVEDNRPIFAATCKQEPRENWHAGALAMAAAVVQAVQGMMDDQRDLRFVVEVPNNWFNERGQSSKDDEAVQKLYLGTGATLYALYQHFGGRSSCWICTPNQWKGHLPKEVTRERLQAWLIQSGQLLNEQAPMDASDALALAKLGSERLMTNSQTAQDTILGWSSLWLKGSQAEAPSMTIANWLSSAPRQR